MRDALLPVFRGYSFDAQWDDTAQNNQWFHWIDDTGRYRGIWRLYYVDFGCPCCGGFYTLENRDGKLIN